MYKFRAKLALFLTLCIFLCSVNSMKVEAAEIVAAGGITAASLFQICLFVGGVALTCYAAGEVIENKDEIAAFGKNIIDSITDISEGWIMNVIDISGQEYVLGSEALELVQDTPWEVIQGGAPNGDDDDNNDKDNNDKKDWLNFSSPSSQLYASFTALGATWFADSISKLYQKWVNDEELTESEQAVLKPLMEAGVDQNDIKQQWSGEPFTYTADFNAGYLGSNGVYTTLDYNASCISSVPICVYYYENVASHYNSEHVLVNLPWHHFIFYSLDTKGKLTTSLFPCVKKTYFNGVLHSNIESNISDFNFFGSYDYPERNSMSYAINFPIFTSLIDVEAYLKGTGAVTDALNYAKTYQNADWLSDDWKGLLIDPLTNIGLSFSQLIDLAKALGVHTVGNNLSAQELADLLKQSLPAVNPELMPDAVPVSPIVPDPGLKPVYYPSPTAHPLPDTDPGKDPGSDPDVTPGTDPKPSETLDPDKIVPDTASDFSDISGTLKRKFPFSLPWDVHYLFTVLADTPKTPRFEIPFYIDRFGIHEVVVIDLSPFEPVSKISRLFLTLFFCYGLMNLTVKIVSVRKEE